jgi:hypothetical protein
MTERQIANIIGVEAGDYRTSKGDIAGLHTIDLFGSHGYSNAKWWYGSSHWVYVTFNDGKAEGGRLGRVIREPLHRRIGRWIKELF